MATGTLSAENCAHRVWKWNVDKAAGRALQLFVNDGHEPWRLDGVVEVAEEAIDQRKAGWGDANTGGSVPKVQSQTSNEAVLVGKSDDDRVRYVVTLRKYSWLLSSARNNWNWVVWLPASVERTECATQQR
jgi:hypothetical protein